MQIGTFTKADNGDFVGRLDTLTLSREIAFEPVSNKESDKAPDYRIRLIGSDTEIGAGWNQTSKSTGNPYIKAKIDDPSFPNTLWGALTANDDGAYSLYWSRPRSGSTKEDATPETL